MSYISAKYGQVESMQNLLDWKFSIICNYINWMQESSNKILSLCNTPHLNNKSATDLFKNAFSFIDIAYIIL